MAPVTSASINFDNTDDLVTCGSPAAFDNVVKTVAAWIKPNTTGGDGFGMVLEKYDGTNGFGFYIQATNAIEFSCNAGTIHTSANNSVTMSVWQHVLASWDRSGTGANMKIYVNGTEVSYASSQNGSNTGDAAGNIEIGSDSTAPGNFFDGLIDEVAVWTVQLSANEITQLASSRVSRVPLQIQPGSLILYVAMDDQSDATSADGDTLVNLVGSANNCTGQDGANNTGLTWSGKQVPSYP